jgi:hypothetical protein
VPRLLRRALPILGFLSVLGLAVFTAGPLREFWDRHHWNPNDFLFVVAIEVGAIFLVRGAWRRCSR